jgi:hypothetical protein
MIGVLFSEQHSIPYLALTSLYITSARSCLPALRIVFSNFNNQVDLLPHGSNIVQDEAVSKLSCKVH